MPKYLGIDYGKKNIGLAISDAAGRMAFPWKLLAGFDDPARAAADVVKAIVAEQIDIVVVGLPINMDGSIGPQAMQTRQFARHLEKLTDKPIEFCDERLSSFAAQDLLKQSLPKSNTSRRGKSKRRIDPVAAQIILQAFLNDKPNQCQP